MVRSITLLAALAVSCGVSSAASRSIEGRFGRVEVDTNGPRVTSLTLRRADGSLEPHSLLSPAGAPWQRGMPDWGAGALTFAVDDEGRRYESRSDAPESVEATRNGIILHGVRLGDGVSDPVAREEWRLSCEGSELIWTVDRTWLRELTTTSTGTPALFFSCRPISGEPSTILPNSVATTFWIAPGALRGWHNPLYRPAGWPFGYKLALANNAVVTEPGGWAVLKLFTAWPHESEPRLAVQGGHLYRRGHFGWLSEAGAVSHPDTVHSYHPGDRETTTLRIVAVPAPSSGHQLAVTADEATGTVAALSDLYGSLLNGGCVNDQVHYNFGNETDGWYYGGASWMKGLPMLAGAPAPEAASSRPWDLARAFRDNLGMIAGTEFEPGRTRFGYNSAGHAASGGAYTDDNIIQVIGGRAYYLYSGDLAFIRQQLPFYRRAVTWYLGNRNADGLVSLTPAHWYYDAMLSSGVTTYHNAFLYRALVDLAGLESAAGNATEAAAWQAEADALKDAINRVLWWEDAPGGPRYVDWIQPDGTRVAYGADLCQFPPLAFGIASPERARKLLATIDRRIAELERDGGYAGYASLSAYWPVPADVNTHPVNQGFGSYMNGGSFLCITYWEIMARCAAGDAEGAWTRLRRFAEGSRLTGTHGFIGNNWVMQDGRIGYGACDEPYLSDMIAVPAALVQGILGIRQTNDGLDVRPVLPAALQRATVEVMHLGSRKRVTIDGGKVRIDDRGRGFTPPAELTWRADAGCPPEADLHIDRAFGAGEGWSATADAAVRRGQGIILKRRPTTPLIGLWKLDDGTGGAVADSSGGEADGACQGGVVLRAPDRAGRPAAARFQGGAQAVISESDPFAFGPADSFTIQAWFQTTSLDNQVIAARPGAFSLGVKSGRLSAWVMEDGAIYVEAAGDTPVADGRWRHAAVVCDRAAQTLRVFLDGTPDGPPLSIAHIGLSTSGAPLTIGAFGGAFPFDGSLDEVSIHRAALTPERLSVAGDYPAAQPGGHTALEGAYTTQTCDWGQPARLTWLRATVALRGGSVAAEIQTSDDGFRTLSQTQSLPLTDGASALPLLGLAPARYARVIVRLATPEGAALGPVVSVLELTSEPVTVAGSGAAEDTPKEAYRGRRRDG